MKFSKSLIASTLAAVSLTAVAPVATAELSASVAVASSYFWRGNDLSNGSGAVSADLSYSRDGGYGGVWISSGDPILGTEYDLYLGYGAAFGDFSVDLSVWSYNYATDPNGANEIDFTDASDLVLSLGYGPVALTLYEPVGDGSGSSEARYVTLGGSLGQFSLTAGIHINNAIVGDAETGFGGSTAPCSFSVGDETCDPIHINLDYAFNDNLTFTLSQFVSDESDDDDLKVVFSYNIPLK